MSIKKSIGWCSHTTNVVTGCLGPNGKPCSYCWAVGFRKRLAAKQNMLQQALDEAGLDINTPAYSRHRLDQLDGALERARKPRRIFFSSMGDLGQTTDYKKIEPRGNKMVVVGETSALDVQDMARSMFGRHPRHTFLVLSKQPSGLLCSWPQNVHIGVSVAAANAAARKRLDVVRRIGCGVRWVSIEPLLVTHFDPGVLRGLDWVVIGTEKKEKDPERFARTAWDIRLWCLDNKIPCYAKSSLRVVLQYPWPKEFPR